MRFILITLGIILTIASCKKDEVLTIVEPLAYFPAYPGSIWYYSNGDVSKVHTEYVAHSYQETINSTAYTEQKLVPNIDHEYLYGYEITQNSNVLPLKKLLSETKSNKGWLVDYNGSDSIYRATIDKLDSLIFTSYKVIKLKDTVIHSGRITLDTVYKDVLVVVEYMGTLGVKKWNKKEYYAKNVGLIQVEINNPYDTLVPIIQKKLNNYNINK